MAATIQRMSPIYDSRSLEFVSHSPEQTQRLGMRLGELLSLGDLVCLSGELGSGKTTLVQGIARGWGALDPVTSPTFVLLHEYRRANGSVLHHLDAYRLSDPSDARALGFDDLLGGDSALLIEWPERLAPLLPAERLWITLKWMEEFKRSLRFEASGRRYEQLLMEFRRAAFGK